MTSIVNDPIAAVDCISDVDCEQTIQLDSTDRLVNYFGMEVAMRKAK